MTPLELSQCLLEDQHRYACLTIDAPPEIADRVQTWGQANIPSQALFMTDDGGMGREFDTHVTVKYGMTTNEVPEAVYALAHRTQPFTVYIGKVSLFRNADFDVVKLDVESPELRQLNAFISRTVPNADTRPDYQPHMTVAYVKKGTCDQLEGMDVFDDTDGQFVAYGMVWRADGSGGEREKQSLLFSKVKQHALVGEAFTGSPLAALAASVVDSWQQRGLDSEEMHRRLCTGHWGLGEHYWYNRQRLPKLAERFSKEMLACISQAFGQPLREADPDEANPERFVDRYVSQLNPSYALQDEPSQCWWTTDEWDRWQRDGKHRAQTFPTFAQANEFRISNNWTQRVKIKKIYGLGRTSESKAVDDVDPQHYVDGLIKDPVYVVRDSVRNWYFRGLDWSRTASWGPGLDKAWRFLQREHAVDLIDHHYGGNPHLLVSPLAESEDLDNVDPQRYVDDLPANAWTYRLSQDGETGHWKATYYYHGLPTSAHSERLDRKVTDDLGFEWAMKFNTLERARPYHTEQHRFEPWRWYNQYRSTLGMQEAALKSPIKGHVMNPEKSPYDDMPFPASADDMGKFLKHRRKKRASRPIL